ncbi:MAG: hypothetical protein ACOX8D_06700 [Methanoculleus sp.]
MVQEQSGTIQTRVAMPAHSKEASIEKAILSATQFADEPFVTDDDSMGEIILITEAFGVIAVCHEANQGSGSVVRGWARALRSWFRRATTVCRPLKSRSRSTMASRGRRVRTRYHRELGCGCFFGPPGVFLTFAGISAEIYTFLKICRSGQFYYIVFTGGSSMRILGLLLAAVGMILYSLVQILEQGKGAAVGWSGGVAE